jgi:CYTH domain-containing protein
LEQVVNTSLFQYDGRLYEIDRIETLSETLVVTAIEMPVEFEELEETIHYQDEDWKVDGIYGRGGRRVFKCSLVE